MPRGLLSRRRTAPSDTPETFAEVMDCHLNALYSAARRLCRSAADAEELVQETCLSAWESFHQLRSERKVRAWLFSILHHCFIDRMRDEKRRPWVADVALEEAIGRSSSGRFEPGTHLELELREAFAALEEEFRIVVWLSDAEGFTSFEIARILDLPQGTVASRLFRGRRRLRRLLGRS